MNEKPKYVTLPTEEAVAAERERLNYQKRYLRTLRTTVYALVVVAAVAVLIATMVLPVLQVSGSSMEPTLSDGDVIVLLKSGEFETGDLVGFYYQNKLLLKRVIAGPGDVVDIDEDGSVYVNDKLLDEPYVTEKALGETDRDYPYQVPEGRYFVMGDNRTTSIDSRSTAIGCIETDQILGKVILRIWPLEQISILH
ncbi:MAG: signal peptidase I [Clostridiales bacterium]|nr:signal peptidase I [Clostridiales bacterium]